MAILPADKLGTVVDIDCRGKRAEGSLLYATWTGMSRLPLVTGAAYYLFR